MLGLLYRCRASALGAPEAEELGIKVGAPSATHEVDDFETIAVRECSAFPVLAGNDFPVQLNRDPVGLHAKLLDQILQRQGFREITQITVNLKLHFRLRFNFAQLEFSGGGTA